MLNSHTIIWSFIFATGKIAGIAIVPINTRWNNADVDFTLADSEAKALVVDECFACRVGGLKHAPRIFSGPEYSDAPVAFDEPDEDDLVGLFYTSGTTGGLAEAC